MRQAASKRKWTISYAEPQQNEPEFCLKTLIQFFGIGFAWIRRSMDNRPSYPAKNPVMDEDVYLMDKEQLIEEVKKLRAGIREHRDSTGDELCWHHPKLWGLLPEKPEPEIEVPDWPEFMKGCIRYRTSLDEKRNRK